MTAILLLHGVPGSAATWRRVSLVLETQHQVLAPPLLGFRGRDEAGLPDALLAEAQAKHVLDILDSASIDDVVLVGHDFGGPVAAHIVATAPERVRALALFATNAFPDTRIPFPLSMLNVPVVGAVAERVLFSRASLAMMVRTGVGHPKVRLDLDHYVGDPSQHAAIRAIFASSLRRLRELYTPVEAALAEVRVPTVVGWGDRDPFFPVEVGRRTADLIPNARFRLYPGAGHFLPEERPDEIAADLLELLVTAQVQ